MVSALNTRLSKKATKTKAPGYPIISGHEEVIKEYRGLKQKEKSVKAEITMMPGDIQEIATKYRMKNKIWGTIGFSTDDPQDKPLTSQEVSTFNKKMEDLEVNEAELTKLVGKKTFEKWFEVKNDIKLSDKFNLDEKQLEKLLDFIDKEFGEENEVLEVKQYMYPKFDKLTNTYPLLAERYTSGLTNDKQTQLDELVKPSKKLA